ncbi:MAG: crotonase/enoyl-CoA hydratase family protein, partial [Desulfobacterales bacterium]|nr:crotonase/enoyl-CoA hydratase family protein [Desulfobacterales bacterium]
MDFGTVSYSAENRTATITLNRPDRFNAINATMPDDIAAAFAYANNDDAVHVIVLTGAGRGFCGGYDLKEFAEEPGTNPGIQEMPWDPMIDYRFMSQCTQKFMSIWRCHKPVIGRIHGDAVAGGSDIALCCDIIFMNKKARIGYPPSRVWGCPTTAMWIYRLGAERAKRMLFTGDLVTGTEAEHMGLIYKAIPIEHLDEEINRLVNRIRGVPKNQLMMMKMMVNQAYENMGLANTQMIATIFDGITRHSPEGIWFKQRAEEVGFKQAV